MRLKTLKALLRQVQKPLFSIATPFSMGGHMKWHSRILSVLTASAALFFALTARGMLRHAGIEQILCCDHSCLLLFQEW